MTGMALNWRAFSRIPYTPETHELLAALELEVPIEGIPHQFRSGAHAFEHVSSDHPVIVEARPASSEPRLRFLMLNGNTSWISSSPAEIARAMPPRTLSGNALRKWLAWHGWTPKGAGGSDPPAPNEQTKTII